MASNFCSGMAWFFLFIIFRILRLNQRDFRDSNESGSFSIFLCILWFLRQARASLLNRILCGQYERYGEDYQWLSELPLYSKTSSVWADWLCQGVLLTLLVWGKKKGKEIKKRAVFVLCLCCVCSAAVLIQRGAPFRRVSAPKLFISWPKVSLWFPAVPSCRVQLRIHTFASAINLTCFWCTETSLCLLLFFPLPGFQLLSEPSC